ncbi:HSP90 family protein [Streptacidiphilus fuscans]|uniref:HSP90 family protein n=1 Tax=Streptacidiphilus fuscans TaxID=2789292 RepID=A0A931FE31_9ACTN|nr:HSP90 family protein [Streptacidiphilus fuscans]MBF9067129.1 HSP90 family protein [Streptacidiphilus fuscans]
MTTSQPGHTFQVDLRGLVDLLSHHLYSSPRVYLRELMQNAVDAITARRVLDGSAPARITIRTGLSGGGISVEDSGVGLTESDVHSFLATIGRSSKRNANGDLDLTAARGDFIGQFGIGLLACFVVADEITVVTRSAKEPGAPAVEWRGRSDGTYSIRTLPAGAVAQPGTTVTLTPRADGSEWLEPRSVLQLARHFGSLLRYQVQVVDRHGDVNQVNDTPPVWERTYRSPLARREALAAYGKAVFDFVPLDTIDLDIPLVGLKGVAFVLPTPAHPTRRSGNRVHLKGMLLSDQATELVPDWAFFVACVVDTTGLRPTASREALYEDETLAAVRDAIGERVRQWLTGLAAQDLATLRQFLDVHHLAVKALARHDDQLLALLLPWLPFETTDGRVSLDEFARTHPVVLVTQTVEEFRQVAPIAAAAGLGVVNGGYVYDRELVHQLPQVRPGVSVADLDPETVTAHLDGVDPAAELAAAPFLARARAVADRLETDVALRAFQPVGVPAMLVDNREARHERRRAELSAGADDLWAGILGSLSSSEPRAQLILNYLNPLIRELSELAATVDPQLSETAVEALYGQALLLSRRPLRPSDHALLNRSFLGLLEFATQAADAGTRGGPEGTR